MNKVTTIILVAFLVSCASIISERYYPVAINSSPSEVNFIIMDKNGNKLHSGKTPYTVTLESGSGFFSAAKYTIQFKKTGFNTREIQLEGDLDEWYIVNLLFGGLLGLLIIDPWTGAMWELPPTVSTNMEANKLTIRSIDSLSNEERSRLKRI